MFNVIINSEQYDEFMAQKEKIKELEAQIKEPDEQHESLYKDYQQAFKEADKDKAALIKENDRLTNVVHKQGSDIIDLRTTIYETAEQNKAIIKERDGLLIENNELKNKVIRFKELVTENYRLKMSINDLKANNKELKSKIKEPVAGITINPCRDLEEAYSPESNTIVKI